MNLRSLFVATAAAVTALSGLASQSSAALVNVALGGKPTDQSSTANDGVSSRAVDGNTDGNWGSNSTTHTDENGFSNTNPFWRLDLGASIPVESITLFNRTDCCSGRLSDISVHFFAADGTLVGNSGTLIASTPELNDNNGGNTDQHAGPASISFALDTPALARYVEVRRNNSTALSPAEANRILSLAEVQVFADNIALGKSAVQSSGFNGDEFPAGNATNGDLGDFTHTESNQVDPFLTIDLADAFIIDSVVLHNRDNCCQGRLRDITVEVLAEDGVTVIASALLNSGGVLGGPAFIAADFEQLFGSVIGQFIRISRDSLPGGGDDNNVLSLGEVQVFGTLHVIPEPMTAMLGILSLGALAVRSGRRQRA